MFIVYKHIYNIRCKTALLSLSYIKYINLEGINYRKTNISTQNVFKLKEFFL